MSTGTSGQGPAEDTATHQADAKDASRDLFDVDELETEALAHLEQRMQAVFGWGAKEWEASVYGNEKIPTAYVGTAMRLLARAGTIAQLTEWKARDRKSTAGRKPVIPIEAVMVLFLTHVQAGLGVTWGELAETLKYRLNDKTRAKLGITLRTGSKRAWYHRIWRAANAMMSVIDPLPAPRNRIIKGEAWDRLRELTQSAEYKAASSRKQARLDWLCNQLIAASVKSLPEDVLNRYNGNCAIDATAVSVPGKPNAGSEFGNRSNPDAFSGRYMREGNHKGSGKKTDLAAYELETLVMTWNKPGESDQFPALTTAVGMHAPGELVGEAVKLNEWHQRLGYRDYLLTGDRAYNGGRVKEFHLPLRQKGVQLVIDYRVDQLGLQGWFEDLILVDGSWYVNWMPEDLITASADYRTAKDITKDSVGLLTHLSRAKNPAAADIATRREEARKANADAARLRHSAVPRIRAREQYRLIAHGKPDKDGFQRFTYPDPARSLVPAAPLKDRKSITIPPLMPETLPPSHLSHLDKTPKKQRKGEEKPQPLKHVQKFPYLSPEWQRHYGMRNLVESQNKLIKHGNHEDLGNKSKRSGRGYAFHYLVSTLAVVSSNLRRIRTFFQAEAKRVGTSTQRSRRRADERGTPLSPVRAAAPGHAPPD